MRHPPYGFDVYYVNVIKIMRKNAQIFVAFSEKLKFMVGTAEGPKNWVSQRILISVSVHFSILWDMGGLFYPPQFHQPCVNIREKMRK